MKPIRLSCLALSLMVVIPGFCTEAQDVKKLDESFLQAASDGAIDRVESFLARGADVNLKDESGQTPLHIAVRKGHLALAELLLAKGANINAQDKFGRTALHFAANRGEPEMANLLIARGADVNAKDKGGDAPLHIAVQLGHKAL